MNNEIGTSFKDYYNNPPEFLYRKELNHFGIVSQSYNIGRKGYPTEVYNTLMKFIPINSVIIDLGCGTGISTRELFQAGFTLVSGCDKSKEQLHFAEQLNQFEVPISYFQYDITEGKGENTVPVLNAYDAATTFQAFHWFGDYQSIENIKKMLKPHAYFADVHASELSDIKKEFNMLMEQFLGHIAHPAKKFRPKEILTDVGFKFVHQEEFTSERLYTFEEALEWLKSNSRWAALKEKGLEEQAIPQLEQLVRKHLINDQIVVEIATTVIIMQKGN